MSANGDSTSRSGPPAAADFPSAPGNLARFSALKSARTSADALPDALHPESLEVDTSTSRKITSRPAGSAWITADDKLTCLSVQPSGGGGTASCHSTYSVPHGFGYTTGDASEGAVTVAGVVPDAVDQVVVHIKGAADQKVPVSRNGYIAEVKGSPTSVSYTDASGEHSWPLAAFNG
ncbi:MAG TPA: hypothetical protein VK501_13010 [Baekduia sp.]|uniref:hypothetical protein n=1 Tax=Baekduia sp. TaxID=2600305 RepID=UPI002C3E6438|nr:hypothetical protein [Baekduia sp.]HMJ34826.1 hypothetical protein [Baekduia sp.]